MRKKSWRRRYHAHITANGFNDNRRDIIAKSGKNFLHNANIVIPCDQGLSGHRRQDAGAIGQSQGGDS
jgi:hypothetical protein